MPTPPAPHRPAPQPTTEAESPDRRGSRDQPDASRAAVLPRLGALGWLRWVWRSLTTMRTALALLLLLIVATLPGSIFPQRNIDAGKVATYLTDHRSAGPLLDRLGFFDVYSSVWFSATYLLLMVSLIGCVLPRTRHYLRSLRALPPRPPARPARLPAHITLTVPSPPAAVLDTAGSLLAARPTRGPRAWLHALVGYRVHAHDPASLSAENGRLREAGNLLFHLSVLLVVAGVAVAHLWQWRADVIVPVGQGFTTTATSLDTLNPGPLVNPNSLPAFGMTVTSMKVTFDTTPGSKQLGQPQEFAADTILTEPGRPARPTQVSVNHPLAVEGTQVYLLGNGYAPVITVKDARGAVLYQEATPFLPRDANYTSTGVVKVVTASPDQIGLTGFFLPTADPNFARGPASVFPDTLDPQLILAPFAGKLFPGDRPQSVYRLDTTQLTQLTNPDRTPAVARLRPGQTYQLPGGRGSITFDRVTRWAGLSVRHTPAKTTTMAAVTLAALGLILSLLIPRRRIFVIATPDPDDASKTLLTIAGTAKTTDLHLDQVVNRLHDQIVNALPDPHPAKEHTP